MSDSERLFVNYDDKIKGPFDKGHINAFMLGGLYPAIIKVSESDNGPWRDYKYESPKINLLEKENKRSFTNNKPPTNSVYSPPKSVNRLFAWVKDTAGGVLIIFVIFGAIGLIKSCDKGTQGSGSSKYSSSGSSSSSNYRNGNASLGYNTPTYRTSHSDHLRLQQMSAKIEAARASLQLEKARIDSLDNQIDRERINLNTSSSYAVDSFNSKVSNRNYLNNAYKQSLRAFNLEVDEYNSELRSVGTVRN